MPEIIQRPIAAGSATALTEIPAARPNWQCVEDYPESLGVESYVYEENGTAEDLYDMSTIQGLQRLKINSISVRAVCERENNTQACTVETSLRPAAATTRGAAQTLTEVFVEYLNTWAVNPETDLFWTIADVNGLEAGLQLISGGAGCEAQCTQLYNVLDVSILGEYISNYAPFYKDIIHVDQGYSVVLEEDNGRSLFNATTVRVDYRDPAGTLGNITGDIIDENRIIVPVTAALNNQTGKWWFKLYAVLAGGEILEGKPIFINISPKWL